MITKELQLLRLMSMGSQIVLEFTLTAGADGSVQEGGLGDWF